MVPEDPRVAENPAEDVAYFFLKTAAEMTVTSSPIGNGSVNVIATLIMVVLEKKRDRRAR